MAGLTAEAFMSAIKGKIGLAIVIKAPEPPVVGGMAAGAVTAQAGLMGIVTLMAIDTLQRRAFESLLLVAGFAAGHRMLANQREAAQVMVKADAGGEGVRVMALLALAAQLTLFLESLC